MFKAISWGQYAGVLFLLLLAYYAYVGLAYYRVELLGLFKNRGKVAGPALAPAPQRSSAGRGSLIAKTSSALPTPPLEVAGPGVTQPASDEESPADANGVGEGRQADELTVGEGSQTETGHPEEQPAPVVELPPLSLPSAEADEIDNYENDTEISFVNDNSINFTDLKGAESFQDTESGVESADDGFEPGFTIGIAQLGNYLERAAEGQVTAEQLVEQEPGLANTDLLLAFFQDSTKNAQRATAHLYAGVAEPVLD